MTRKELDHLWRHLAFWKRLIVECLFAVLIVILVEVLFEGRSANFIKALFEGLLLGFFYAVLDHACFAQPRAREPDRNA